MNLTNKNILVLGLGKTGYATAKVLAARGANVLVSEPAASDKTGEMADELGSLGIKVVFGEQTAELVSGISMVVPSPGIPNSNRAIEKALAKGVEVISEIELAYRLNSSLNIIGITGTNGKTSVTTLITEMLKENGRQAVSAGNIGNPLIDHVENNNKEAIFVVELSSFQLENTRYFRPWIGTILNIAQDHIDWHGSLQNYAKAKWKLFANQNENDFAVINLDDNISAQTMPPLKSKKTTFSLKDTTADYYLDGQEVTSRSIIVSLKEARIFGRHNNENLIAATAIAGLAGASSSEIETVIKRFKGLDHRISEVSTIGGITYYNDSKATNPHAAISAIHAFEEKPLILLMGGKNKGNDFSELAGLAAERAKEVILFGESAYDIAAVFPGTKRPKIFGSMIEAVREARKISRKGDNVLLSPACASFDEFNDYKHRGNIFKEVVCEKPEAC